MPTSINPSLPGPHKPSCPPTMPEASETDKAVQEVATIARSHAGGNAARILLSVGAMTAGYKLIKDTVEGTESERKDKAAALKEHAEWKDMEFGWGHYSGNPGMDQVAHEVKRFFLFGPMNVTLKWKESQIKVNSFINDVIIPNLVPIGIMTAGFVGLVGPKNLRSGANVMDHFVKNYVHVPPSFKVGMKQAGQKSTRMAARGLGKLISLPFKTPMSLLVTAGALLLGSFTWRRFQDSYGHDGQHHFFRTFINEKEVEE